MKDNYMIFVLIAVMLTPFFPILLKSKCPSCRKRKLEHLESVNKGEGTGKQDFVTYYHCHACDGQFERKRSGPLKQVHSKNDDNTVAATPADLCEV